MESARQRTTLGTDAPATLAYLARYAPGWPPEWIRSFCRADIANLQSQVGAIIERENGGGGRR